MEEEEKEGGEKGGERGGERPERRVNAGAPKSMHTDIKGGKEGGREGLKDVPLEILSHATSTVMPLRSEDKTSGSRQTGGQPRRFV